MGNWATFAIDLDNDGLFETSETQTRHHNKANELQADVSGTPAAIVQPTLDSGVSYMLSTPLAVPLAYAHDDNGSRTRIDRVTSGTGVSNKFVYDAWNRLVRIQKATVTSGTPGTYATTAEYTYNGLHWRTSKTAYTTPGGTTGKKRWFTYNAAWQAIVEEIDDDYGVAGELPTAHQGLDRVAQQFFGLRGINDSLYRREDRYNYVAAWTQYIWEWNETEQDYVVVETIPHEAVYTPLDGFFDNQAFYQLSDAQFSVVSIVAAESTRAGTTSGTVVVDAGVGRPGPAQSYRIDRTIEINEYDPYGLSRRWVWSDFSRDGFTSVDDISHYNGAYFSGKNQADTNEDGALLIDDLNLWMNLYFTGDSTPADRLTASMVDNPYGFCGYYADFETYGINGPDPYGGNGFLYHVRHRVYDPIAGRWLQRDPAGFVDGMNLYEYCGGGSVSCFDPMGLNGCNPFPGLDGGGSTLPSVPDGGGVGPQIDKANIDRLKGAAGAIGEAALGVLQLVYMSVDVDEGGPFKAIYIIVWGAPNETGKTVGEAWFGFDAETGEILDDETLHRQQGRAVVQALLFFLTVKAALSASKPAGATAEAGEGAGATSKNVPTAADIAMNKPALVKANQSIINDVLHGRRPRSDLPKDVREAAADFYQQVSESKIGGTRAKEAQELNAKRAKYLRGETDAPPGNLQKPPVRTQEPIRGD